MTILFVFTAEPAIDDSNAFNFFFQDPEKMAKLEHQQYLNRSHPVKHKNKSLFLKIIRLKLHEAYLLP